MTTLFSGVELALTIKAQAADDVHHLTQINTAVQLAIVVATDDESSKWYVRSIVQAAEKLGIAATVVDCGANATREQLTSAIDSLAADPLVHGIIVQTPLPVGLSAVELAAHIPLAKDVDGANALSLGQLVSSQPCFPPATAAAVMALLDHYKVELSGKNVVVIGRSTVVGKPVAHLLLDRNATVTMTHSRTRDLPAITRGADVVVVAIGRAGFVTDDYIAPGAVVIDVGTNTDPHGKLIGDVEAQTVNGIAGALSPVPGGVGPVTTALLLAHTVHAAKTSLLD